MASTERGGAGAEGWHNPNDPSGAGGRHQAQHPLPRRRHVDGRRREPRHLRLASPFGPPPMWVCPRVTRGGVWYGMNYAALTRLPQLQCVARPHPNLVYGSMRRKHWYLNQSRVSPSSVRWRELGLGSGERCSSASPSPTPAFGRARRSTGLLLLAHSSGRGRRRRTGRAASEDPF